MRGLPGCGTGNGFLITICQPGSYRLAGNLTVASGVGAVLVAADNVTLDLNGFTITHALLKGSPSLGIYTARSGLTVENGKISGFNIGLDAGLNLASLPGGAGPALGTTVAKVTVFGNQVGLALAAGRVQNSLVFSNDEGVASSAGGVVQVNQSVFWSNAVLDIDFASTSPVGGMTGTWDVVDANSGGSNTGDGNTGDTNPGFGNTGGTNTGSFNSGDTNTPVTSLGSYSQDTFGVAGSVHGGVSMGNNACGGTRC